MPTKREEEDAQDQAESAAGDAAESSEQNAEGESATAEAGWYPNPKTPDREWYWDGSRWTGESRKADSSGQEEADVEAAASTGRTDIAEAANRMHWKFGSRREIKRLAGHLHDGEVVADMAAGNYGGGAGLLVLTDQRLFFLRDGWTGATHEDFPLERITTVGFSSRFGSGTVSIHASGNTAAIDGVLSADGKRIAAAAREAAGPKPVAQEQQPAASEHAPDPIDQLKKLGELKDRGVLTHEEFEEKKKVLLDRL